jgi:hypothetical protein
MYDKLVSFGSIWAAVFCLITSPAWAQTWQERIETARDRADELAKIAEQKGAGPAGTLAYRADRAEFRCMILAEILNIGDVSDYVELYGPHYADPPDMTEAYRIQESAIALSKWAAISQEMLALGAEEQRETWALTCDGHLGIPAGLLQDDWQRSATFRGETGVLFVLGDIEKGFFEEFEAKTRQGNFTTIMFGSRGGGLLEAVKTARLIREKGYATDLYANCASACSLAYLGGSMRIIDNWRFKLGFHQLAAGGEALPLDHALYREIEQFADDLGIDGGFVVDAMRSAAPHEMNWPEFQDLCDANVTWVRGNCTQPHPSVQPQQ